MKYKVNDYVIEADNRLELLEKIIAQEKIKIEEIKEENGKFVVLSQRDSRWANNKIGKSNITVGGYGCLITCLSMFSSWYNSFQNPGWMAKNLKFTSSGLLLWNSINDADLKMRFVWRYYARDDKKIREILNSRDNAVILQVNDAKHWVALIGYSSISGYKVADPFYGDVIWLKKRYKNITGFAEVTRRG